MLDAELLRRYAETRDADLFAALVKRYADVVYAVCLRVTGDPEDARDASQECFLALARQAGEIRTSLPGWLHSVAFRRASDIVRSASRRRSLERTGSEMNSRSSQPRDPTWDEIAPHVDRALEELPADLRDTLVRYYLHGETQAEIAATLGLDRSAVSRRVTKGLEQLRRRLQRASIVAPVAALTALLSSDAASAAPATLTVALGKMAMAGVGGTAAAGTAGGTTMATAATGGLGIMKLSLIGLAATAAVTIGVLVTQVNGQKEAAPRPARPAAQPTATQPLPEDQTAAPEPRIWHILRQTDTQHLTFGLPPRLEEVKRDRDTIVWQGMEKGCAMTLDITVEDREAGTPVEGEIVVGFFADPRWWLAPPVQARSFPGPGRYTLEKLIPGKYCLGAMIGNGWERDIALGCHAVWPDPVEISPDLAAEARVLVSLDIKHNPGGAHNIGTHNGLCSLHDLQSTDPKRLVTIRTVDENGRPVPFCHLTLRESIELNNPRRDDFLYAGTDWNGFALVEIKDGRWLGKVSPIRYDFLPDTLVQRWFWEPQPQLSDTKPPALITAVLGSFPTGSATVRGQVHDQYGKPLKEYYITFSKVVDNPEAPLYGYKLPVTNAEGRFEITGMPGGLHKFSVRAFDYAAYDLHNNWAEVDIPREPNGTLDFEFQIEAKTLWYGQAVYEDEAPVYPGMWIVWFEQPPQRGPFPRSWGDRMDPDGSFRISLTQQELEDCRKAVGGMVRLSALEGEQRIVHELGDVHIDKLSTDPEHPTRLVFPRPKLREEPVED